MAVGGPPPTRGIITKHGSSPLHFLRVLKYSRPYMRYLWPGIACVVFVALTYSINIMALAPLIQLIVSDQSIPAWVHEGVSERRLGLAFDAEEGAVHVADAKNKGALPHNLTERDQWLTLNAKPGSPAELFGRLARSADGESVVLGFRSADAPQGTFEETVQLAPVSRTDRVLLWTASWLPQEATKQARMATLKLVLYLILAIGIFGAFCRFTGEYLISLVAGRTVVAIRRRMYDRVLKLPVSHFATHGVSDTISRFVQDSQDIYRGLNFVFAKTLREPLKAFFTFIAAMIIDWRLTLIAVVAAPVGAVMIRQFGRWIRKANRRLLEGYGRMLAALEGAMSGIRVVKGYTMENYERRHLHGVDQHMLKQQLKIARVEAASSPIFEAMGRVVATVVVIYFAHLMLDGRMSFAKFGVLAACMAGMFDPIRKMSSFYNRIQRANAAVDRVFEVIDLPIEASGSETKPPLPGLAETIELRGVRFTYSGAEEPALDDINLVIRRGERVAFVGPNGSGKTTLLSLLIRFFEPDEGVVLFDGRDLRDHSIVSLRKQMSLITQDTVIFADTLSNNIAYGDERLLRRSVLRRRHPERRYALDGDEERIIHAAEAAYADEFIREKPDGYDTYVGEHGATLSGGQKQRIAIARAILRNAPIFIFDEATSQIDAESEQKIHDAVEKFLKGRTALIIAHRFSTVLQADRIVVMDRGRIVDVGRHEELIDRCTLYQTLYGSQIIDPSGTPSMATDTAHK